jgi:hypothetical protein
MDSDISTTYNVYELCFTEETSARPSSIISSKLTTSRFTESRNFGTAPAHGLSFMVYAQGY